MSAPISATWAHSMLRSLDDGYPITIGDDQREEVLNNFPELRQYLLQRELLDVVEIALRAKLNEITLDDL